MNATASTVTRPPLGQVVRANVVQIAIFTLGVIGAVVVYAVGIGRVLERIDVIERAQAATSVKVETIDRETRAAIGRTDRNTAVICQALRVDCERPAP